MLLRFQNHRCDNAKFSTGSLSTLQNRLKYFKEKCEQPGIVAMTFAIRLCFSFIPGVNSRKHFLHLSPRSIYT